VEIYLLVGQIAATVGDHARARREFSHALALQPDADLHGVSPKIARPLAAARGQLAGGRLAARYAVASKGRAIEMTIEHDPLAMAVEARVTDVSSGSVAEAPIKTSARVPVPGSGRVKVIASIHDRWGNTLVAFGTRDVPIVVGNGLLGGDAAANDDGGRSIFGRWYVWAGAAIVAGGVGTGFGLAARAAQDDLDALNRDSEAHSFNEAMALEDRWRRRTLIANISFGTAAAFATVSAVLGIRSLVTSPDEEEDQPRLSIAPTRGGATAGVSLSF
jgi:hypothetical protein